MNRRGFIGSILAVCVAPAIVRADSLMRIVPRDLTLLLTPAERLAMNPLAWAGAIREWSGWDIRTDAKITRFDVVVANASGSYEQLGVDITEDPSLRPTSIHREMALEVLKRRAAEYGRPVTGRLVLPTSGYGEARFL